MRAVEQQENKTRSPEVKTQRVPQVKSSYCNHHHWHWSNSNNSKSRITNQWQIRGKWYRVVNDATLCQQLHKWTGRQHLQVEQVEDQVHRPIITWWTVPTRPRIFTLGPYTARTLTVISPIRRWGAAWKRLYPTATSNLIQQQVRPWFFIPF